MADFSIKIKAEQLGKTLDGIGEQLELEGAVSDLAHGAYAKIAADAQSQIGSPDSRQEYLKGLEVVELGAGSYLVTLKGEAANKLEDGYDGYSIKDALLRSKKIVQLGDRSGQPWVQTNPETKFVTYLYFLDLRRASLMLYPSYPSSNLLAASPFKVTKYDPAPSSTTSKPFKYSCLESGLPIWD